MYRLYNPWSGEHFYTAEKAECMNVVAAGWVDEGVGWIAPTSSDVPVYRMYNQWGGEHHYTTSATERDTLVEVGWTYEGVGWYSSGEDGVPLYRDYNPYAFSNNHNYTTNAEEHEALMAAGWIGEGFGWYGTTDSPSADGADSSQNPPKPDDSSASDESSGSEDEFPSSGGSGDSGNAGGSSDSDDSGNAPSPGDNAGGSGGSSSTTPEPQGTYTIAYDANGGTGSMSSQTATCGVSATLKYNTFQRSGYTFAGWCLSPDGDGRVYANYAQVSDLAAAGGTATVYAQWADAPMTVRFDSNGAPRNAGAMSNQSIDYNTSAALNACTLANPGCTFTGWNTERDGTGVPYSDGEGVLASERGGTLTLYAQWGQSPYTVVFNANGGTGTMEAQSIAYGTTEGLNPNTFTREGHVFWMWSTSSEGKGTTYEDCANAPEGNPGASVALYARWIECDLLVKYHANGGTGDLMPMSGITYGEHNALLSNTYTNENHWFVGWGTSPDSGVVYAEGEIIEDGPYGEVLDLYAQWVETPYTVKYYSNGGTGEMANQYVAAGSSASLNPCAFTRAGYGFKGWNTKSDGTGTPYSDGASINGTSGGTLCLYAQWVETPYTVNFNSNGGTGTMASQSIAYGATVNLTANAFTRSGYKFAGWNSKADGSGAYYADRGKMKGASSGGSITLYAQWSAAPYTVTFNANGGSGSMTSQSVPYNTTTSLKVNTFTRSGYKFAGWKTAPSSGTSYADKGQMKGAVRGGTITLYAQWAKHGWITENGKTVYYENGTKVTGKEYNATVSSSAHASGIRYFNSDGTVFTGWKDNKYYNPSNDGIRASGKFTVPHAGGSNTYFFDSSTGIRKLDYVYNGIYFKADDGVGVRYDSEAFAKLVWEEYNKFRRSKGYSTTSWSSTYASRALQSVKYCAAQGELVHNINNSYANLSDILAFSTNLRTPHEYIYGGGDFQGWANSEGHRKMMQCSSAKNAAFAVYYSNNRYYAAIVYDFDQVNQSGS